MTLGRKSEVIGDSNIIYIGKAQQMLGFFDFFLTDITADGNTHILFEQPGQITGRKSGMCRQIFNCDPLIDVGVDIVDAFGNRHGYDGIFP